MVAENEENKSSMFGASINLVNSIMAASIVVLPYTLKGLKL